MRVLLFLVVLAVIGMFGVSWSTVVDCEAERDHAEAPFPPAPPAPPRTPLLTPVALGPGEINVLKARLASRRAAQAADGARSLSVVGEARKTREEAWAAALEAAAVEIARAYRLTHELPANEAEVRKLIADSKEIVVPVGEPLGDVMRYALNLELSQSYVEELGRRERASVMESRFGLAARALVLIVAGLFAVAGYVRLEEWSKGYYTGVWKTLAVLIVVAAVVGLWYLRSL
jgi:hypothetical protein